MTSSTQFRSGKGAGDENFPVASLLIQNRHRPVIRAFYDFVRTADDIADHPTLVAGEKLDKLERLEKSLLGQGTEPEGLALRAILEQRGLSSRHAQDLLCAFRQDVTKHRYANWEELIDYCSLSAMPVGRFVLDVHGESRASWPASDALCAALQVINHLQDCAADYRTLDRIYVPLDVLAMRRVPAEALGEARASPALRASLHILAARTAALLEQSGSLPACVSDTRLAVEISVIQTLARRLLVLLQSRDPLSESVHLGKVSGLAIAATGAVRGLLRRLLRASAPAQGYQTP
jgi:hydroxysqualene synthase